MKILFYLTFFIAFGTYTNVHSQYCVGVHSGYIRSGFISFHKPDKVYAQKHGLRDGYGANVFLEIKIDSTNSKIKIESGYSKQHAFLDVEGSSSNGKFAYGSKTYGRKIDYTFDFFNINVLYSQQLINRRAFSMNALLGLSFAYNFKVEEKGFGWDYTTGHTVDSLWIPHSYSDYSNWEVNSTQSKRSTNIAPTLGLECSFRLSKKTELIFQNRGFIVIGAAHVLMTGKVISLECSQMLV